MKPGINPDLLPDAPVLRDAPPDDTIKDNARKITEPQMEFLISQTQEMLQGRMPNAQELRQMMHIGVRDQIFQCELRDFELARNFLRRQVGDFRKYRDADMIDETDLLNAASVSYTHLTLPTILLV